jgi:hypothetical protein
MYFPVLIAREVECGKKVDSLPSEILDDVLAKTATLFQ